MSGELVGRANPNDSDSGGDCDSMNVMLRHIAEMTIRVRMLGEKKVNGQVQKQDGAICSTVCVI